MLPRTSLPRRLPVKWSSSRWRQRIDVIEASAPPGRARPNGAGMGARLRADGLPTSLTISYRRLRMPRSKIPSPFMNFSIVRSDRSRTGFTLIELLVVISIIGVLASMAIPVLSRAKVKAQITKASMEINDLAGAINSYYTTYSRMPASRDTRAALDNPEVTPDYTYGTYYNGGWTKNKKGQPSQVQTQGLSIRDQRNNSEVVAILKDMEHFRNGAPTPNLGHSLNPQKITFLNAKEADGQRPSGIGPDGLYRDPWGNPYIVTLDMNGDDRCRDGLYGMDAVSNDPSGNGQKGFNGLYKASRVANAFEARTGVMVWSLGPDGLADQRVRANQGVNKDNILNWK